MPPLANTVPSGSIVRFSYARGKAIGAVDRQLGVGWFMSRTAVSGFALYVSAPLKSGSAHVPAFMILPGRYMTALMPSNGLVAMLLQVPLAGSKMRVVVSGPASSTRPSESRNMNG